MKLKLLREHFQSDDRLVWTPKKPFKTVDEIEEDLGFKPEECLIYPCGFCGFLHTSNPRKYANVSKR